MGSTILLAHNKARVPDYLLETAGPVDSLTLEISSFVRRRGAWKEENRRLTARYSWDNHGRLVSREIDGEVYLHAYDAEGRETACYCLDESGAVSARTILEWDEESRLIRRILKTAESPEDQIWTYEHDKAGRMRAERQGNRVRVEKLDDEGRIEEEYLYDGEKPDLITEYTYDERGRSSAVVIKEPDGTRHRVTEYSWDKNDRLLSEVVRDSEGRVIKDETYVYGATHGSRWLERVTWVPNGKRGKRLRPREVVYRSFSYGGLRPRSTTAEERSIAFTNGIYHGPALGEKPEGVGIFHYNDESRYEGEFRDGAMEGDGLLIWPDGRTMKGNFNKGVLEGDGECSWADGSRYEGCFRHGRMHGPGVFVWADGTRFEGLFDSGRRTDQGAWERPGE